MTLPVFLNSEPELDRFLADFAAGRLPKEAFTHAAHIAMGACYCLRDAEAECLENARRDIRHFNESVGGRNTAESGYHETLTRFWLGTIRRFLQNQPEGLTRRERVRRVVEEFAPQRDLFRLYYTYDVVTSQESRARWMPPDRTP